ncbi:hypothetical protein ACQY1Q_12190 [Tenacibaculum sp. TC6]|uniref:hypothetical protein n=1 Tax=Tenacibaculum sp. TC6 TaxID=3423223 RepID=UPI003D365074
MDAYTLKEKKNTKELHIFKGIMTSEGCTSNSTSICGKMQKTQSQGNIFTCNDEVEARIKSAKKGRKVCGTCVSHLYSNY